jgi:hypothetical protein
VSAPVIAYKGFARNWQCNGYQFEVGKSYTHEGDVAMCASGFHACLYPLDVFAYYPPTGRLAQVELADVSADTREDSKRVARTITLKAEIDIAGFVKAAIEYTTTRCDPAKAQHATGYSSAASATGDSSAASATGDRSAASATGYSSAASATGYRSAASATGDRSAASATGLDAIAAALGFEGTAKADERGVVVVAWWDAKAERKRLAVGYVDEDGIERNVAYRCDGNGELVRA